MTIIKTGCVLRLVDHHTELHNQHGTLYGDLHVVGSCCIMHFPNNQVGWKMTHGTLSLMGWGEDFPKYFYREAVPYSTLVVPAYYILMCKGAIHPYDLTKLRNAWGTREFKYQEETE